MTSSSAPGANVPARGLRSRREIGRYALAGILFGVLFPVVATAIRLWQNGASLSLANVRSVQQADPLLWIIDTAPLFLGLLATVAGSRQDALTERNWQLLKREHELTAIQNTLALRVQERTLDLEERNRELREAVVLTGRLSRIGDTPTLVDTAVQALAANLSGYNVDIYVLDSAGAFASLVASSSRTDNRARKDRAVRVGDTSSVGRVAAGGRAVVAKADMALEADSETAGTMALPLNVRGRVLGVLALRPDSTAQQQREPIPELIQMVADQIAAAIDSTRLFDETRAALSQLQRVSGHETSSAWRDFDSQRHVALQYTTAGIRPVREGMGVEDPESLRAPLKVRGRQIGSIALHRDPSMPWSDGERDLAVKVAAQVASALENVRLLEDSVQRAEKERRISEITSKIGASINMRNVLQTAVEELGRALPGSDVTLKLGTTGLEHSKESQQ